MSGHKLCPLCRFDIGEAGRRDFFESITGKARYCQYYYNEILKDTLSELYNPRTSDDAEMEVIYLREKNEKLTPKTRLFDLIVNHTRKEVEFLEEKTGLESTQPAVSKTDYPNHRNFQSRAHIQNSSSMQSINTILDRILLSV